MKNIGILGCAVAMVSLVGCGASTTTTPTVEAPHGVLSTDAGTMGKALDDGIVLSTSAGTARGIENNATTGLATPVESPSLTLGKGADGKFTMTLNGEAVTFDGTGTYGSDGSQITLDQGTADGGTAHLASFTGDDVNELGDPASIYYSYPIRASVTKADGSETFVYAVLGTETLPSALSGLPAAMYTGKFVSEGFEEVQSGPWENQVMVGNFNLLADFAKGEVTGNLSNFYFYNPTTGEFDDSAGASYFVLERTAIVGNGYTGTVTAHPEIQEPGFTGSGGYSGTFYGPAAEATSGVIWYLGDGFYEDGSPARGHDVGVFHSTLKQ